MINVVGAKHGAREFLQQVVLFVGCAVRSGNANRLPAVAVANRLEICSIASSQVAGVSFPFLRINGWRNRSG